MARRHIQTTIFPIDTRPSVAVGLRLPFNGQGIFGQNYTTQEQIKSNIINYMLTNPGERMFNPTFGAGIRDMLFSSDDDIEAIDNSIKTGLANEFPQVTILSLSVTSSESNAIHITLKYSFNNNSNQITISI